MSSNGLTAADLAVGGAGWQREALGLVDVPLALLTHGGGLLWCNTAAVRHLGLPRTGLAGQSLMDFAVGESVSSVRSALHEANSGRTASFAWKPAGARALAVQVRVVPLEPPASGLLLVGTLDGAFAGGPGSEGASQRAEALCLIARGIAHELTNHVTIIGHTAEVAEQRSAAAGHPPDEACAQVRAVCERAQMVLRHLQSFTRGVDGRRSLIDLGETVADVVRHLRPGLPESVRLDFSNRAHGTAARASSFLLEELLIHLLGTAAHGEGVASVRVEHRHEPPSRRDTASPVGLDNGWSVLSIEMHPENSPLPESWRALVSTSDDAPEWSPLHRRLRQIVVAHGAVCSLGERSNFRLALPSALDAKGPASSTRASAARDERMFSGRVIALVDEDLQSLEFTRSFLRKRGVRVFCFDALEAFSCWLAGGGQPDVIVAPHSQLVEASAELVARLHAHVRSPWIQIGGAPSGLGEKDGVCPPQRVLTRPFRFEHMIEAIAVCLVSGTRAAPPH